MKVGDNVRFLNSVGSGVVKAFQGKNIVLVEDQDGFETPVLISDVVVVEPTNQYNFVVEDRTKKKDADAAKTSQPALQPEKKEPEYELGHNYETKEGEQLSLYLAFVADNNRNLQESGFELYLINDSNYYFSFVIASAGEKLKSRFVDCIEPQTKIFLCQLTQESLSDYQNLRIQGFAYKKYDYDFKPAIDVAMKINMSRFFKLHSFVENDFFDQQAILEPIVRKDFSVADVLQELPAFNGKSQRSKARIDKSDKDSRSSNPHVSKPNQRPELIEVDLHINELLDNTNGLSPKDMLDYQIEKFNEVMRANLRHNGTKIVFIHGKGEGKLRQELLRQLKLYYPKCTSQDANFQKYGFGATMITINH